MIVVGFTTMSKCWDSMLPTWMAAMGIAIVAAYVLPFLFCCCEAVASWVMAVDAVFCLLWFCCGCYWTWLGDNDDCVPHVFWIALVVTFLPAVSCILCICKGCVIPKLRQDSQNISTDIFSILNTTNYLKTANSFNITARSMSSQCLEKPCLILFTVDTKNKLRLGQSST